MLQKKLWRWKRTRNESWTEHGGGSKYSQDFQRFTEHTVIRTSTDTWSGSILKGESCRKPHPLETPKSCQLVGRDRSWSSHPSQQEGQAATQSVIWMFFAGGKSQLRTRMLKSGFVSITFHTAIPHEGDSRNPWGQQPCGRPGP